MEKNEEVKQSFDGVQLDPPVADLEVSPQPGELIDKANVTAERLEKANKEFEKLLARHERLAIETTLGGSAIAGVKQKTQDELEIEYAKRWLAETGMEKECFPDE
jgi:hypothetical protein